MHYIPLLFLCAKVFSFIYHRELALFLHNFRAIVEARRSTKKVHVVFIDKTTIFFLIYFLIDILFLFYCIWLITGDSWEPGCMLLFLSALESYGVQGRIAGAYEVSPQGFIYAKIWFKYLMSAQIMFILINNSYYNLFLVLRSCGGANVLKYLFGGDFIAYNDKKQIITYEKYFHQTI
jgi:hypothetical protein